MIRRQGKEVSTTFIPPPLLNYPATLINHITLPPFSEQIIEAQLQRGNMMNALFEPNPRLQNKALFTACALWNIRDGRIRISIINATSKQRTLSEGTKVGIVTQLSDSISLIIPEDHSMKRIPQGKACTKLIPEGKEANITKSQVSRNLEGSTSYAEQHQCRACHQYFDTGNGLF